MAHLTIEATIEAVKAGEMVVLVDDEDRENEGDLMMAAEKVSPQAINFMARYGRGLICLPMTGEKLDALEKYDPARLASRILGMGDVIGLIEKAELAFDATIDKTQAERMLGGRFDLEDWLSQVKQVRKMGPLAQIADMLPGRVGDAARQADPNELEQGFRMSEAIISSMTAAERRNPEILNASRRRRIAAGSGAAVQDVNRLIKQFREAQKLMKIMSAGGMRGLPKGLG